MADILDAIAHGRSSLEANILSKRLADPNINVNDKLECIPLLSFFVLSFKDCMAMLQSPNPTSALEQVVNAHALEDADHWKWFLQDLNTLDIDGITTRPATEVLGELWSESRAPIRDAVYAIAGYIQQHTNPVFRLLLIEVIEDGYGAFARHMGPVMQEADLYDKLLYFGHTHNEAEAAHEIHQEPLTVSDLYKQLAAPDQEQALAMVTDVYNRIDAMHTCFANAITPA